MSSLPYGYYSAAEPVLYFYCLAQGAEPPVGGLKRLPSDLHLPASGPLSRSLLSPVVPGRMHQEPAATEYARPRQ